MDILPSLISQIATSVHVIYYTQGEESNKWHVCHVRVQQSQHFMCLSLAHYCNVYKYCNSIFVHVSLYVWEIMYQ